MPFIPSDLYLASGTAELVNTYVDPVYKFDSSSFYNWEEDNLPIYDLEDRDDLLFSMAGYPTSSVDGIMLTVSCCGIDNKKVFGTVADAVKALPNTIRFPVIIEVAASGELGELRLENFQFEGPGAGIEVINRGFAKVLTGSGAPISTIQTTDPSLSSILTFQSLDLSTTMFDSSSIGVSSTVWASEAGAVDYWNAFTRAFVSAPEWATNTPGSNSTTDISTAFSDTTADSNFMGSVLPNTFTVTQYSDNSASSDITVSLPDSSILQRSTLTVGANARTVGFVYANALSNVVVTNCSGRVYIRGFCVDGSLDLGIGGLSQRTEYGYSIINSDLLLENCTATRCSLAGMNVINSNIILNRGFIAYRNYESITTSLPLDTKTNFNTPGLRAENSVVTLSSTPDSNKGLPLDSPFMFSRNKIGMELINSTVRTPSKFTYNHTVDGSSINTNLGDQTLVAQFFSNIEEGIKADNSIIDFGQRIACFNNKRGIRLQESELKISEILVDHNQEEGLLSYNSTIIYNKDSQARNLIGPFYPQTSFRQNGQHLNLSKSKFIPKYTSAGMIAASTRLQFKENFKRVIRQDITIVDGLDTVPAVFITGGSTMEAIASRSVGYDTLSAGNVVKADTFRKGLAFSVNDHSTLRLIGHQLDHTIIIGPWDPTLQQNSSSLYAGNQSSISISGPTHIGQTGINSLAEDSSTITFGPINKDGIIDSSAWSLERLENHTKVELHSTRACLVANRNSDIIMKDLGDFQSKWNSTYKTNLDLASGSLASEGFSNSQKMSPFSDGGFMAFHPNPYGAYGTVAGTQMDLASVAHPAHFTSIASNEITRTPSFYVQTAGIVKDVSNGGFCVRALQGSNVLVQNTNFLCNWTNTSGAYFDVSATDCELLRIWNIADDSKLISSYTSVNGQHPQDASSSYYGPSAVWAAGITPLFGAPSSTPDTSSLSVLDTFGLGVSASIAIGTYGQDSFKNVGPFRLFVSVDPKAKFLGYPVATGGARYVPPVPPAPFASMGFSFTASGLEEGIPYQVLAQGYNPSGDCSATPVDQVSSIYQELAFSAFIVNQPVGTQQENVASSFFYTKDILRGSPDSIQLDEASMNLFANAKNGTLRTSNRKPIVSYLSPHTKYPGESSWIHDKAVGLGSVNLFDTDRNL